MTDYTSVDRRGIRAHENTDLEAVTAPQANHLPDPYEVDPRSLEHLLQQLKGVLAVRVWRNGNETAKPRILIIVDPNQTTEDVLRHARRTMDQHATDRYQAEEFEVIRVSHTALETTGSKVLRLLAVRSGVCEGRIDAQVEIGCRGLRFVGKAEHAGAAEGVVRTVAHAAANALVQILDEPSQVLVEEVQSIQVAGRWGVVVALSALQDGREHQQLGCAWFDQDERFAVAQAVVNAAEKLPLSWMLSGELRSRD